MNKEKVALIGYGYWGQKLYKYLQSSEEFDLQYVFFPSLKGLDEVVIEQKYGKNFVSTIDVILDDKSVPNVIIATPINTHYTLTKQALIKCKNVLVEKPLTIDPLQNRELLHLAKKQELKLETEYTFTYSDALFRAQQFVEEGTIGEIESIVLTKKQLGRFLAYDVYNLLGSHCLSILDMFLPIRECKFHPKPLMTNKGLITAAVIYFEGRDEKQKGYIDLSLHCPARETKLIIYGQTGTIIYDPSITDTLKLVCYSRSQPQGQNKVKISQEKVHALDENHNLQRALKHFSKVIRKAVPDNSNRANDITEVISGLYKKDPSTQS
jgi:predicted dehydrogenase